MSSLNLEKQREYILERLPTNIPIKVAGLFINDEGYWKRRCNESLDKVIDTHKHKGSWKTAFFELFLTETIENYIPLKSHEGLFWEIVDTCAPYVDSLDINQLLPPIKKINTVSAEDKIERTAQLPEDDASDSDSEKDAAEYAIQHLKFQPLLTKLQKLTSLSVCYNVKNCGMNFEWQLFQFTGPDCLSLSVGIKEHKGLSTLRLTKELDLSHNFIEDRGARAIGKLLNERSRIRKLILKNNGIRAAGCHAISYPLFKNACELEYLDLRLNRIQDDGAINLGKALSKTTTLKVLDISGNDIGVQGTNVIAQALASNQVLTRLDLSNNKIGLEGGQKLQRALLENKTLEFCDLRMSGCGQEAEYHISNVVKSNYNFKFLKVRAEERGQPYAIPTELRRFGEQLAYPVSIPTNPGQIN
ncbi:T-complex-associated testis-expressed protein 1 [Cichlidogyrus casuarinus]|uniref:T-complex-associated testis-expressed protein 1 n=1 Tax=Cichlidogyrus casuarinus TaxID=1844966 RepID=A0ABD2Q7V4_9PLAT